MMRPLYRWSFDLRYLKALRIAPQDSEKPVRHQPTCQGDGCACDDTARAAATDDTHEDDRRVRR
jgi:hypothetical protein